jgi:hypothetical protein
MRGRAPELGALALSVAVQLLALRSIWFPSRFSRDQFRAAYFEPSFGGVGVAIDDSLEYFMLPDIGIEEDGAISVPPGRVVAFPLGGGQSYRFTILGADVGDVPYVVLGRETAGRFLSGNVLDTTSEGPRLRGWDPSSPWRTDGAWLAGLQDACAAPGTAPVVEVSSERVTLGSCSGVRSSSHGHPGVLLVAGPRWVAVRNDAGPWKLEQRVLPGRAAGLLVLSLVLVFPLLRAGLGRAGAISLPTSLLLVHFVSPGAASVGWALCGLLGAVAVAGRLALACWRRPRLRYTLLAIAAFLIVLHSVAPTPARPPLGESGPSCLVSGYSTVRDARLRDPEQGLYALLRECHACGKDAGRFASDGQHFSMLSTVACTDRLPLRRGGKVVFLGGSNDDFFWNAAEERPVEKANRLLSFLAPLLSGDVVPAGYSEALFARAERNSLEALHLQREAISDTLSCLRQRESRLYFFHDFLVTDLTAGRTPGRTQMVDARRDSALAGGAEFTDLLEVFGAEVGVSWFSDTIHLSAHGHRRVADYICRRLRGEEARASDLP